MSSMTSSHAVRLIIQWYTSRCKTCWPLLAPPVVRKAVPLLHSSGPHNVRFEIQINRKPAGQAFVSQHVLSVETCWQLGQEGLVTGMQVGCRGDAGVRQGPCRG